VKKINFPRDQQILLGASRFNSAYLQVLVHPAVIEYLGREHEPNKPAAGQSHRPG
jgi:hypothetical protein